MHSTAKFVPEGQKNTNGFVLDVHMEAYLGRGSPTLILALMEEWLKLWAILKKLWRHLRHCYGRQLSKRWDSDNRSVNTLLLTSRNTNNKACLFNRIIPYLFASLSSLVYRKLSGSIAALNSFYLDNWDWYMYCWYEGCFLTLGICFPSTTWLQTTKLTLKPSCKRMVSVWRKD